MSPGSGMHWLNPHGYAVRSSASRHSRPLPCPSRHQPTWDLQLNVKDLKKLHHILSLPGAPGPISSVPPCSWKRLSSSGMVDSGLQHIPNALIRTGTQSLYRAESLTPSRTYFFFPPNSLTRACTQAQASKAAQLALFSKDSAAQGSSTFKIAFLESLI